MRDEPAESRALGPLWALSLGAVAGSCAALGTPIAGDGRLHLLVPLLGAALVFLALRRRREAPAALWLIAGFAAVFGQGLDVAAHRHELARIIDWEDPTWIRARLVVTEGWTEGRWGWRTRVRVLEARHDHLEVPNLSRCRLEIRGRVGPLDLPQPGAIVNGFVSIRGSPSSPCWSPPPIA